MAGENRQAAYLETNPAGELPCLQLDDGRVIAETIPICEYLEELHPEPSLIGTTPEERARVRMFVRWCEQRITEPLGSAFRSAEGAAMFKERRHLIPQAADDWKQMAQEGYAWLDEQIAGREFIAGDRFSLADVQLYCLADFGGGVGQPIGPDHHNVRAWFERMGERPSAEASLHPVARAGGMRA